MNKEQILNKCVIEHKAHSIDPFEVFERMTEAAKQAMDEYAKEVAIDFSVWVVTNDYSYMSDDQWLDFDGKTLFSNDLYENFMQSKQITNGNG